MSDMAGRLQHLCRQCAEGRKPRTNGKFETVPFVIMEGLKANRRHRKYGYVVRVFCAQCGWTYVGQDGKCVGACKFHLMHEDKVDGFDRRELAFTVRRERFWRTRPEPNLAELFKGGE